MVVLPQRDVLRSVDLLPADIALDPHCADADGLRDAADDRMMVATAGLAGGYPGQSPVMPSPP